jgi:hypothetical protein
VCDLRRLLLGRQMQNKTKTKKGMKMRINEGFNGVI